MENPEDQIYVNKVKGGDPASYAFLVDKYKYMAYTIALKIVRNTEDAKDIAQESFVKAYQQLHQFEGRSKFSTWLYTIVYRTAISKQKENKIETLSINDHIRDTYSPDHHVPQLAQLEVIDEQRYVKQAIQKLPGTEALLITLFYINENSVREIGEITGLSTANIKIKLLRARKKLERELKFLLEHEPKTQSENGQ
jgi:RNA polymerase sigma-70 factor (ECF subfamily)